MTERTRINLPAIPDYTGDVVRWAEEVTAYLDTLTREYSNLLGGSLRWQNLRSQLVSGTLAGVGPPQTINATHNLGKVPEFYVWNVDGPAVIYATPANQAAWTTTTIQLTSSSGAAHGYTLLVM